MVLLLLLLNGGVAIRAAAECLMHSDSAGMRDVHTATMWPEYVRSGRCTCDETPTPQSTQGKNKEEHARTTHNNMKRVTSTVRCTALRTYAAHSPTKLNST
uniref:Secreted protein n=1 Tax=Ceratitis capitata TaxID=7213 RepID=W8B975_CERCA